MEDYQAAIAAAIRGVLDSPAAPGLQHLNVSTILSPESVRLLAKAKSLGSLRRLRLGGIDDTLDGVATLFKARWFRQLRHLRLVHGGPDFGPFYRALGDLPHLHTLLPGTVAGPHLKELAAGRFPALGEVHLSAPKDVAAVRPLVGAKFPRLAALTLTGAGMRNEGFETLLRADWFARLRVLRMQRVEVGDKAVVALSRHPVARGYEPPDPGGGVRQGRADRPGPAGAFPELTTLNLGTTLKRKATEADLVAFLTTWSSPRLRYLSLAGWPVGDAAAKVIARSPAFAGLTRLNLDYCRVGNAGAKALIASPHLQNLVQLRLSMNPITTGADALADPAVMPRLGDCWLNSAVPAKSQKRIRAAGRRVVF